VKEISSKTNPVFKMLKSLTSSKGIKTEGLCLASGQHVLAEISKLKQNYKTIHFRSDQKPDYLLTRELFNELTPLKTDQCIYLVETPSFPEMDWNLPAEGIEVLLPVGDPKNLGALIRTCMAFETSKIILLRESAHPFLPEVIKTSAGHVFDAPLFKGPSLKDVDLNTVYALDKEGTPIESSGLKGQPLRLLLGEEGGHLTTEMKSKSLSIEISEKVESLNVNSCLSVALYALKPL